MVVYITQTKSTRAKHVIQQTVLQIQNQTINISLNLCCQKTQFRSIQFVIIIDIVGSYVLIYVMKTMKQHGLFRYSNGNIIIANTPPQHQSPMFKKQIAHRTTCYWVPLTAFSTTVYRSTQILHGNHKTVSHQQIVRLAYFNYINFLNFFRLLESISTIIN
ncbi:Hypothetical_protein [Hexamita inflata]|uniref:Hypothetical_protein n=1 Tax=Hexamita inflata TaxID=28002 RepID=A0AA86NGG4_9EUKA|nr:Hypothetical protein HINF_LOCUS7107 [Hexamita inflata]